MPTRPPDTVIFALVFVAILFILGGNIYTLIRTPPVIAGNPYGGPPLLISPGLDSQLGMEGIVASVVVMIGAIGLGMIYYASKYVFQPGYATRLIVLGMLLAGTAFLVLTYMMNEKIG
ncbi:MAG: hypothetical protein ACXADO_01220 [Candidatus Thorarchaeota archaeon]|jgi:hypothetical protein